MTRVALHAETLAHSSNMTLAVVTFNQATLLKLFLARYLSHGASLVRLLTIDDGSTDETPELLRLSAMHPEITTLRIEHGGAAKARNVALKTCVTQWLAFTDTDCEFDSNYFLQLLRVPTLFPNAIAVEGAVLPPDGPKPPLTHWLENAKGGIFATANLALRPTAILTLGGFDEAYPSNLREDTDLGLRLLEQNHPCPFFADLQVRHPFVPRKWRVSMARAWHRQWETMQAESRLYEKHRDSYRKVRRLESATATMTWWRKRHLAFYAKQNWAWTQAQCANGFRSGIQALVRYSAALVLAAWEQLCLNLHWFLNRKKLGIS